LCEHASSPSSGAGSDRSTAGKQQTSCTSLPLSIDGTDRRTDRRTPDRYTDAANYGQNSITAICRGSVVQRTDATTAIVDKVEYTTNVQQGKFTTLNVCTKPATNPQQVEVMESGRVRPATTMVRYRRSNTVSIKDAAIPPRLCWSDCVTRRRELLAMPRWCMVRWAVCNNRCQTTPLHSPVPTPLYCRCPTGIVQHTQSRSTNLLIV